MDAELAADKEKLQHEREEMVQAMEKELARREEAARSHLEKTREEEMEMIIAKLDAEYAASKAATEAACELRVAAAQKSARQAEEQRALQLAEVERQGDTREATLNAQLQDSAAMQASLEEELLALKGQLESTKAEVQAQNEATAAAKEAALERER